MFHIKNKPRRSRNTSLQQGSTYSYYANSARTSDTKNEQRLRQSAVRSAGISKWRQHGLTIISMVIILITLGYALSLNTNPVVIPPHDQGSIFLQDANTYQTAAHKILDKSVLNKNKITINTSAVTKELKNQFPELSDVSVTLPIISRRPLVYIVPSQPTLVLKAKNGQFILNERGVAVLTASKAKGLKSLELPALEDKSNLSVKLGKTALPATQAAFIKEVNRQLEQGQQKVKTLILPSVANQLDIQLEGRNYYAKMDMQGSSEVQAGALLAVLKHLDTTKQTPSEYIDVRIEGRAYYK